MEHHEWLELAPAYSLDALEPDERHRFEAHLQGCESCRERVERLRETTGLLALAVPPAVPSPELRSRVLAAAAAGDREEAGKEAVATTPTVAPPALAPVPVRRAVLPAWLTAAAAIIMAVVAISSYVGERARRQALERELVVANDLLAGERAGLASARQLLDTLLAPDIVTVALTATGAPPAARVFWNRDVGRIVLTAFALPAASEGRTYQLWGIDTAAGTAPVSLGTFDTGADGRGTVSVVVPAGITFDLTAVTEEPAGGSPQPTSAPFLLGQIGAD